MESVFNKSDLGMFLKQNLDVDKGDPTAVKGTATVLGLIEIREAIEEQTAKLYGAQQDWDTSAIAKLGSDNRVFNEAICNHAQHLGALQQAVEKLGYDVSATQEILRLVQAKLASLDRSTISHCDTLHKMAEQYNEMESWKTRVEKMEARVEQLMRRQAGSEGNAGKVDDRLCALETNYELVDRKLKEVVQLQQEYLAAKSTKFHDLAAMGDKLDKTVTAIMRILDEICPKVDALDSAVQGVINHQGETAKLLQDLAEKIDK